MLEKVIQEKGPQNQEEWLQCVAQCHVKNTTIQTYGFSPCQLVFGRNPSLPGDLLEEPQNVVSGTAPLMDEQIARTCAIRAAARKALLELQDAKSMRKALLARPRVSRSFQAGDIVAYWRDQKWNQGTLSKGGKWYGSGVVLGLINKNVVIAHRTHIIRCAPEQVRFATQEEKALLSDPHNQLLGIKDLMNSGTFRSSQFHDLISQAYPPQEEQVLYPQGAEAQVQSFGRISPMSEESQSAPASVEGVAATGSGSSSQVAAEAQPSTEHVDKSPMDTAPEIESETHSAAPTSGASGSEPSAKPPEAEDSQGYGPMRRTRVPTKTGPLSLYRPLPTKQDDFVEVLQEVLPQLLKDATQGVKRAAEGEVEGPDPKTSKTDAEHAVHLVQHELTLDEAKQWWTDLHNGVSHEVLIAQYMQKRAQKEIHHSNNPPLIQAQVDAAKVTEWNTLIGKNAVRLVSPSQAKWIKEKQPDRIMGSRFCHH